MTLHRIAVPDRLAGQRLDRCLAELGPGWSRSHVRRLIDQGCVQLDGEPARPAMLVKPGAVAVVDEPPPRPLDVTAEAIALDIVYEDEHLLVVNKPAGMVIHPGAGNPQGTLVNALLHHCQDLSGIGGVERPGIVHRLDKDTTGLVVVAKSDRAHRALALAFRRRKVEKTYLALCYGHLPKGEGVVDSAIGRHHEKRKQMAATDAGRPARTLYRLEEDLGGVCLVACRPVTGRTHQIRVHMAHVGHALVGDQLYAGRQWRNLADPVAAALCRSFPRQALHAWRLAFAHPVSGESVHFEAPLPADLAELVASLRAQRDRESG